MVFDEFVAVMLLLLMGMIIALVKECSNERRKKKNGKSKLSKSNDRRSPRP